MHPFDSKSKAPACPDRLCEATHRAAERDKSRREVMQDIKRAAYDAKVREMEERDRRG